MITVADYLIKKLKALNIEEVFGLPGDYNFEIVEAIEKDDKINWIGCTNELNAGYAADGYARIKGYAAIVTTFGVGELSAINAVAGSMAENVPIVKIVGVPKTSFIKNKTLVHHNLDNADYKAFYRAYCNVVKEACFLDEVNPKKEIDRIFDTLKQHKKPVYIALPMDVALLEVDDSIIETIVESDKFNLNTALIETINLIKNAKNPVVLVDGLAKRFSIKKEVNDFLQKTKIPSVSLLRGVDVINNSTPNYLGVYCGNKDNKTAYQILNESDCIIALGTVLSDLNTFGFDYKFNLDNHINIQYNYTKIKDKTYDNILISDFIKNLVQKIDYSYKNQIKSSYCAYIEDKKDNLTCDFFYSKLNSFLKKDDILITEVGLPPLGSLPFEFPDNIRIENQILWGSIGWATPCTLGCCLADKSARTILITGDGSHQLTAQELATIMRNNLKPVIFVINNNGYTIERLLCNNPYENYNNISHWNYSMLPKVFYGDCFTAKVQTKQELIEVLNRIEKEDKMCYIELIIDAFDVPRLSVWITKHKELFSRQN